jgi:hypothetical protein
MKPAFALPLALVFVLLLVIPVSATAPVIETGTFGGEPYMLFDKTWPCPGIEIWNDESGTYRQTAYLDNEGNVLRIQIHFLGFDNLYNPANPDVVLTGKFSATADVDLNTGQLVFVSGIPAHITYPGYGTVEVRAGRWLAYPIGHVAGKDSLIDPKDMAQFCPLLAGD